VRVEKKISGVRKDYIASYLRSQISNLQTVLECLEKEENYCEEELFDRLKKVRRGFYQFRDLTN